MHYAIKTVHQLRPILQGFRKSHGMTQAAMAEHLGVTQQTYAELEANPAAVSVERLLRVLRVLGVELVLSQAETGATAQPAQPAPARPPARPKAPAKAGKARPATGRRPREDW
ncbi:putative transcriptional regulator [Cupriavidus taiwanensis]|uniref:helix-turn-helix transcriptional regulator n=1 Tax=Cupriavidus taiwanensis TaxID=164546 RepID=UPI000E1542B9|nr:helix-turn-helix transcriptional regulator [Cupriavidus taiwanensis]SOZ16613.1 putative transcriptional regulator [Cupriavidus taiwanensis]SOZ21797.1 putative transcriptional regulator [Cupriavidus taiwanensis]SOZ41700.1 putative transcriptional regulator [Cupriavidus taiwanensis]SOZ97690.1 putative transcriptional regulator [Cupriavidus taiwanensis]SPA15973.1 putative transcriptional regulator [Cupriavidus taiwanensis]